MIYNVLKDVLTLIASVGLGYLTVYIRSHYTAKQAQTAESIARLAVTFAQQVANSLGLDSQGKLNAALTQAKEFAAKHGINYTDEQWKTLLEAAVNIAKKDWEDVKTETQSTVVEPVKDQSTQQ